MDAPVVDYVIDVADLTLGDVEDLQKKEGVSMTQKLDILSRVVKNRDVRTIKIAEMEILMSRIEEEVDKISSPLTKKGSPSKPE